MGKLERLKHVFRGSGETHRPNPESSELRHYKLKERIEGVKNIFMFDGHGSQFIGMGKEFGSVDWAQEYFNRAEAVLAPYLQKDLRRYFKKPEEMTLKNIMFNGPEKLLMKTQFAQPAMALYNFLRYEELKRSGPRKSKGINGVGGISFGSAVNACHLAGVFGDPYKEGFEKMMDFAYMRGKIFQKHADGPKNILRKLTEEAPKIIFQRSKKDKDEEQKTGLILVRPAEKDRKITEEAKEQAKAAIQFFMDELGLDAAIQTSDFYMVLGGEMKKLVEAKKYEQVLKEKGVRVNILKESCAAFHTRHIKGAVKDWTGYLYSISLYDPVVPIVTNTERPARLIHTKEDVIAEQIKLVAQPVYADAVYEFLGKQESLDIYNIGRGAIANAVNYVKDNKKLVLIGVIAAAAGGTTAYLIKTHSKKEVDEN